MSSNAKKKKKSVTMDPNGQTRYTSKKTQKSRNSNNSPHAAPKYSKSGSATVGYDPVSKTSTSTTSSSTHSTPKATVLRFEPVLCFHPNKTQANPHSPNATALRSERDDVVSISFQPISASLMKRQTSHTHIDDKKKRTHGLSLKKSALNIGGGHPPYHYSSSLPSSPKAASASPTGSSSSSSSNALHALTAFNHITKLNLNDNSNNGDLMNMNMSMNMHNMHMNMSNMNTNMNGAMNTDYTPFNSTNTQKHMIFAQLRRKPRGKDQTDGVKPMSLSSTSSGSGSGTTPAVRPTFQFKIGMQVGVALGDCFLQLQKLENSMEKLRNVSEDITDVMQCIEQMGGADEIKQRAKRKKSASKENSTPKAQHGMEEIEDPVEEVHVLNDNLCKWQKDASKRMKNVSVTVSKLQAKLEDLDEYHSQAQQAVFSAQKQDQTQIDKAMETIKQLQAEVDKTKMELTQKTMMMQQLKKSSSEPSGQDLIQAKLDKLESKEKELDRDAEIIATQSEELRKESERLLTERDEVRKQKEQWQKMIDEVKEQKAKLEKRESELQANHKKLLELHETLSEEKKKLHKKARKIKAREKRLNAIRAAQSQYVQQQTNQYQVPSSNGSDYAESELTYFSDGDTEIASVNSISDDESQDNYHKQSMKAIAHLGVPQNPLF